MHTEQLGEPVFGSDQIGKLFMFLGELERFDNEVREETTLLPPRAIIRFSVLTHTFDLSLYSSICSATATSQNSQRTTRRRS